MTESVPVPNATLEKRVTQFTHQRDLVGGRGVMSFTITEYLASDGQPTGKVVGTISDMVDTHEDTDAAICPGAAIAELGFETLVNPSTGHDLSQITQGDMVVLVERICLVRAKMKGLI